MRVTTLCLLSLLSAATAFTQLSSSRPFFVKAHQKAPVSVLHMSTTSKLMTDQEVPIIVYGQNIELTDALKEHVKHKIGRSLAKLATGGAVTECDVILSVSKNPKIKNGHKVEVVTNLKGTTLICQNESPDMYESINMAAHALNRKLNKYKQRRMDGHHGGAAMSDDLMRALDSLEEFNMNDTYDEPQDDFVDPDAVKVTKVNSFDLSTPMSQQEAIFSLDYIDHDFFVYLSEETNKISVVYKRHLGGVGLIEP